MEFYLPRFLVIADGFTATVRYDRVRDLAAAGVLPWVQLRDHWANESRFRTVARRLVSDIRSISPETMISVNGDTSLAAELDIGIHLGFRSIAPDAARSLLGSNTVIGYSAHADTHLSMVSHCHYVTFSPVYPVEKALALEPLGLERFAHMTAISPVPVFALGAITPERVADCLSAGAYGIAVLSGVMGTEDAVEAAGRYIEALDDAIGVK